MTEMVIFFSAFSILANAGCLYMCWKIAHLNGTPTGVWYLFLSAFAIRLVTLVNGLFYTKDVAVFLDTFSTPIVMLSYIGNAVVLGLFFTAILKIYLSLRNAGLK